MRTEARIKKITEVLRKRQFDLTVVMENINDPHNLSAVLRSCDAVGVQKVHLIYYGDQPIPKLSDKSSASAKKWLEIEKHNSVQACFEKLRGEGKTIYTTHLNSDAISIYEVDFCKPSAIVFGNEHLGVSEEALKSADKNIIIPQVGMISSLNISVACAVILYEAFRQRLNAGFYDKLNLDEKKYFELLETWIKL